MTTGAYMPALPQPRALPQTNAERVESARRMVGFLNDAFSAAPQTAAQAARQGEPAWLYPELAQMTQSGDVTAHYMTLLMQTRETSREARNLGLPDYTSLAESLMKTRTQSIFWAEIGSTFDHEARNFLLNLFAGMDERFVDRVASMGFVWAEQNGLDTEEKKEELYLNLANWAYHEQMMEEAQSSNWDILAKPARWAVNTFVGKPMNAMVGMFSGADQAARRGGLTPGQQLTWGTFGVEMDGIWGKTVSGLIDGSAQIFLDPLVGATKFVGGVRLAGRVANAAQIAGRGRFATAARAAVPFAGRDLSGLHQVMGRSPMRRVGYALASKTPDELFQHMAKKGVIDDIISLAAKNDKAALFRKYQFTRSLSDIQLEALGTFDNVTDATDFLSSIHLVDRMTDASKTIAHQHRVADLNAQYQTVARAALDDGTLTLGDVVQDAAFNVANKIDVKAGGWAFDEASGAWHQVPLNGTGEVRAVFRGNYRQGSLNGFVNWMETTRKAPKAAAGVQSKLTSGRKLTAKEQGYLQAYADAKGVQVLTGGTPSNPFRLVLDESVILRGIDGEATGAIVDGATARQILREKAMLDAFQSSPKRAFVVQNFARRVPRETFRNMKMWDNNSYMASAGRRIINGFKVREPDAINIMESRKGAEDVRRTLNHFGVRPARVDELVNQFLNTDITERLHFITHELIPEIGTATNTKVLQYNLMEVYNRLGVRQYSTSGTSKLVDAMGAHDLPILPSQLTNVVPIPTRQIHEIMRRSKALGVSGMRWIPKGLLDKTQRSRQEIYKRFQTKLGPEVELSHAELQRLAYSYVGPDGHGRGAIANLFNWMGGNFDKAIFQPFKKSMLILRPVQWLWRVALLEEPMRAAATGLPSYFTNPFTWAADVHLARYAGKASDWRRVVNSWVEVTSSSTLTGMKTPDMALAAIGARHGNDVLLDVLGGRGLEEFADITDVRRAYEFWLSKAVRRPNMKAAVDNVPREIMRTGRKIDKLEQRLVKQGLAKEFDILEDVPDIQNKVISHLLHDEMMATGPDVYRWSPAQSTSARKAFGQALAGRMTLLLDDPLGFIAVKRVASKIKGGKLDKTLTAEAVVSSSSWRTMRPIVARLVGEERLAEAVQQASAVPSNVRQARASRARWDDTGTELYHGTRRGFDSFDASVSGPETARGTKTGTPQSGKAGGKFYFSDDPAVASRFADAGFGSASMSDVAARAGVDNLDDLDPRALDSLFEGSDTLIATEFTANGDPIWVRAGSPEEMLEIAKASGLGLDEIALTRVHDNLRPQVRKEVVYGQTLDLSGVLNLDELPEGLEAALAADGLLIPQGKGRAKLAGYEVHERSFENTADWMRQNGYGKAKVPDSFESGHISYIGLEDFIGEAADSTGIRLGLLQELDDVGSGIITVDPDVILAQIYMDEILGPEVHALFGGLWNVDNAADMVDIADRIASRSVVRLQGATGDYYELDFSRGARGNLRRKVGEMSINETSMWQERGMATEVVAPTSDPRFMVTGERQYIKRLSNWILNTFGEEATQVMSRRPAFMFKQRHAYEYYTKLGMSPELATSLSMRDAVEVANYTFYNLSEMPHYIKKMNKFIPFFGATWEVAQTWFGKIPMFMGGGGVLGWMMGMPAMARSFDRIIQAGVSMGLVQVEVNENGRRDYNLILPNPGDADWDDPGEAIGAVGGAMMHTMGTVFSHIIGMRNEIDPPEGGYSISLGHPLDVTSYGALSYINLAVGMVPAAALPMTQVARIAGVSDHRRTNPLEGESLLDIADRMDVEVEDMLRMNRPQIVEAWGWDVYENLMRGNLHPADYGLSSDVTLVVPNTGIGAWVYDNILTPFGEVRDVSTMIESLIPAVPRNILFSLGLSGWVDEGFWTDGEFSGLGGVFSQATKTSLANSVTESFMHLESTEGLFTEILEQAKIVNGLLTGNDAEAYGIESRRLAEMEDDYVERAVEHAAGTIQLRSMMGFMLPSTPRFIREHQEALNQYWGSREFADDLRFGTETQFKPGKFKSLEDLDAFQQQLSEWLMDPSGQGARALLRKQNPEIFSYLQPKTYWADGGLPPEISGLDSYMESIAKGERKNVPIGVLLYRMANAGVDADYWAAYTSEFGRNPTQAAANAMWNYERYQELQDERYAAKDALLLQDDMRGGAYLKWREKNSDEFSLIERQLEEMRDLQTSLRLRENMVPDPMMSVEDQRNLAEHLDGVNRHVRDTINSLREQMEEDTWTQNPWHEALNQYWDGPNSEYYEEQGAFWDAIAASDDRLDRAELHMLRKQAKDEWWQKNTTINGVAFPSPIELSWARKTDEEKAEFAQRNALLPLEFLDLESTNRIVEMSPGAAGIFPTERGQMKVYHLFSQVNGELNRMFRANEITSTQRTKMREALDLWLDRELIAQGREAEARYRHLWPIEKLHVANLLPPELEQFLPAVRFIREALAAEGVGPTSTKGRELTFPLYERIYQMREADPQLGNVLRDMGLRLFDTDAISSILPRLFFDDQWSW